MDLKVKFELEFPIQASPQMLYQYISSASGLSEWFAENVNSRGIIFSGNKDHDSIRDSAKQYLNQLRGLNG